MKSSLRNDIVLFFFNFLIEVLDVRVLWESNWSVLFDSIRHLSVDL
jgi:hypothetical protein